MLLSTLDLVSKSGYSIAMALSLTQSLQTHPSRSFVNLTSLVLFLPHTLQKLMSASIYEMPWYQHESTSFRPHNGLSIPPCERLILPISLSRLERNRRDINLLHLLGSLPDGIGDVEIVDDHERLAHILPHHNRHTA